MTRRSTQELKANYLEKGQTHPDWYSSASSDRDTGFLSPGHQSLLPDLCGQPSAGGVLLQSNHSEVAPALPNLQTVKRHYIRAIDYQTHILAKR